MLEKRKLRLQLSQRFYIEKKKELFQNKSFSYSPEEGSEPWGAWFVLPWEYDPYNYRFLRRGVSTLIRNYKKKKITRSKFIYLLDILEYNWDLTALSFYHSNDTFFENVLGGKVVIDSVVREYLIPAEFSYLPYTFFLLARFFILNAYREGSTKDDKRSAWGPNAVAFFPVPSRLWDLRYHSGVMKVAWCLPIRFIYRWTDLEQERYLSADKLHDRKTKWWKSQNVLWRKLWSPSLDAETHAQMLEQLRALNISASSSKGSKRFFLNFYLKMRHPNYEFLALDLPALYTFRTWITIHYIRKFLYASKEGDALRLYIFALYTRLEFDMDHVDRVLNFISWMDYLVWGVPFFKESRKIDQYLSDIKFSLGFPVFSRIRRTFWK